MGLAVFRLTKEWSLDEKGKPSCKRCGPRSAYLWLFEDPDTGEELCSSCWLANQTVRLGRKDVC